jgi:hypothetical protein
MANKIHFRLTAQGHAACACGCVKKDGKVNMNQRSTYATIPASCVVGPDEFRATAPSDRCAHCADQFTARMNARRVKTGKPLYKDAFTKELA